MLYNLLICQIEPDNQQINLSASINSEGNWAINFICLGKKKFWESCNMIEFEP